MAVEKINGFKEIQGNIQYSSFTSNLLGGLFFFSNVRGDP
jgi:hypothetical protein